MKIINFTLRHFKSNIITQILNNAGYTSLSMYEIETHNPLYEIIFNETTGLFTYVDNEIPEINNPNYYKIYINMDLLNSNIKNYLYHKYIKHIGQYISFEHYYSVNYSILPKILVFIPYNNENYRETYLRDYTMIFRDNKIYLKGNFVGDTLSVCNYNGRFNLYYEGYEFPLNYKERLFQLGVQLV